MLTKQAQQGALLAALREVVAEQRMSKVASPEAKKGMGWGSKALGHTVGRVAAAPFNMVGGGLASILMGPKQQFGRHRGKRLQAIGGGPGKGLKEISPAEYTEYKTGRKKGKVYSGVIGNRPVYYRQRYGRGGLIGLVRKHPGKALGAAGLAYLLGTSKAARDVASAINPVSGMPKNELSPDLLRAVNQPVSRENPLGSSVWG